ncbi:MAG: TIGR02444 family protein [Alphaproteobacteria bacterium]|nr:TIGR02444 family protein [Alphaproteobacteria bacterium]
MSDFLPHPFWNFSLEVYGGDGAARACLELQERRAVDVNVLLYCAWLGASGRGTVTVEKLRAVIADIARWQTEIIQPARALRQKIKTLGGATSGSGADFPAQVEAARRKAAEAELAAEHVEQLVLAAHAPFSGDRDKPVRDRLRAAVGNLGVYAVCLGVTPDDRDREAIATILAAAFPVTPRFEVERAVGLRASSTA